MMAYLSFCNVSTKVHTYSYVTSLTQGFGLGPFLNNLLLETAYGIRLMSEFSLIFTNSGARINMRTNVTQNAARQSPETNRGRYASP